MNQDKLIQQIRDIFTTCNKTNDINTLIECNMKLAGYFYFVIEAENDAHKLYLDCYNTRKEFEANHVVTGEGAVSKLQNEAVVLSKGFRENEVKAEVLYNKFKGLRQAVDQFIDVNTQKIAHLRKEYENKNN